MKKITNKILIVAITILFVVYFAFFSYLVSSMLNGTILHFLETFFVIDGQDKVEGTAKYGDYKILEQIEVDTEADTVTFEKNR
ncbi:MAG: hypothetical protein LBV02_04770 [Bacteroidales bacterium]|jgi:hypothetical protein|nr:hypothetical protein [Bacteroidales bacterium]